MKKPPQDVHKLKTKCVAVCSLNKATYKHGGFRCKCAVYCVVKENATT